MIKFKGRSSVKQYLPMKPTKRGFKIWTLADASNGYVYSFRIYKGKETIRTEALGERVVKDIVKELRFSYRKVYFDNFFTTPNLLEYLYKKGIYLVLHKCMDKKPVFLLSNFHNPTSYDIIQRKQKNGGKAGVQCPTSISDYNIYMGGVDKADQRKESYSLDRKSRRY
jgi:hypothetical protein